MSSNWSPHARYRLYTSLASYTLLLSGSGRGTREFEDEICTRFNVAAAVCVPMARMGIFLALKEFIQPGQRVVLSPLTIVDVVNAVILAGGIPVFADIHRRTCALDIAKVEALMDPSTGAVLLTHLHGEAAGAHVFRALCEKKGVALIEDTAQAFGGMENGKRLGTIGNAGIYSFGLYKNLTVWRGGMVVSDDTALIERIRKQMRELPRLPHSRLLLQMLSGLSVDAATHPAVFATITSPVVRRGFRVIDERLDPEHGAFREANVPRHWRYRMRDSQAQLALRQLHRIDQDACCRIANAGLYHDGLADQPVLVPARSAGLSNVYSYFPIQLPDRAKLVRYAQAKHRDFAAQHLRNCADLTMFSEFYRDCPNARLASAELVLLPTYPRYPASEVERNIEVIQQFFHEQLDGRSKTTAGGISRARALSSR